MSKYYAIKCTNCAAPLDILGGGRVSTVTCSYCHSVLDMNDHYNVLAKFNDTKHPKGPFKIGMRGNIKGVEWTIIGWIHYKTGEFPSEEWDEFFLYSPTHGYAWLVYENNKVYFSKKVRDFDLFTWQDKRPKTLFYHKGHYLQKEASYLTYVEYVEGELNWVAKFGDSFTTWDYEGVGFKTLNIEKTGEEIEVYHTERLNKADIYSAFGLEYNTKETQSPKEHRESTTVYEDTIEDKPTYSGWKFLFVLLLSIILFSFFSSKNILSFETHSGENKYAFSIKSNAFLTQIHIDILTSPLQYSKLSLFQKDKKIFYIDKSTVYYVKKYLHHTWTDSGDNADIYLHLPQGDYTILFKQEDDYPKNITISEKVIRLKYILLLFIAISVILIYYYRHLFSWKLLAVPAVLGIVIIGYELIDTDFIFGLGLFAYYIYDIFTGEDEEDD